ncbi:TerD family protein [Butyrivibrio sp. AC2005]|uniref:TerD family protein n=1 Tax=Butyrivibrio sp. AC2005 TaxID=1280672 RepID=UPI0003FB3195|nr:TerD family protein [Butyrivibrio sp. AC2005]
MGINLQKGQKIDLTKGGSGLSRIMVGLGWDEAQQPPQQSGGLLGLFKSQPEVKQDIDCDASAILLNANGKLYGTDANDCVVYFGNLTHSSGAIVHQGDNLTGEGEGDDEQIMVNLSMVPSDVDKIVFVVNIYDANVRNQHFGMIQNAFIRLVDLSNNSEICRFNLSENYSGMTGMVVGEIYRRNGEWKFNAIGQPVKEASRLESLLNLYV